MFFFNKLYNNYFIYFILIFVFVPLNYIPQLYDGVMINYTLEIGKFKDIDFDCCSYDEWDPHNQLIYCDPPYQITKNPVKYRTGTKKYDVFDNQHFWDVMRLWSKDNYVFISETTAPSDFVRIWSKSTHRSVSQSDKTRYKNPSNTFIEEGLYVHESFKKK